MSHWSHLEDQDIAQGQDNQISVFKKQSLF